tara:strand:+ start:3011 stop:3478 length:468 start_codon:yes stop_codon:yes gene_type:complete
MTTLHDKVTGCLSHLIGIAQFSNSQSSLKNTVNELNCMYTTGGLDKNYIKIVVTFYDYIKHNKVYISEHMQMCNLAKFISILKNQPKKFPIGASVVHIRRGFCDRSTSLVPNNITYQNGIIDDYDYTVNQYQLKYDDGSIVGWIQETDLLFPPFE